MGFKIYALEFDAEIEFTEDCKWIIGMFGQQLSFQTSKPVAQPKSGFSWNSFLDDTTNPGTLVKRGQRVKLSGVIRFVKREKGWAVDGVEVTKADVGNAPQTARSETDEFHKGMAESRQELKESENELRLLRQKRQELSQKLEKLQSQTEPPTAAPVKVEKMVVEAPPISENTEAWEFDIVSREELPRRCCLPAFSHDFSKMAYAVGGQLVIRSVKSSEGSRSIRLPADVHGLVFSRMKRELRV